MSPKEIIDAVLQNCQPLKHPRGDRMPLLLWSVGSTGTSDDAESEDVLKQLDARGVPVFTHWTPNPKRRDQSLAEALRLGRLQKKLGLQTFVNANACMHLFCNGSPETAHVTDTGEEFFDLSFTERRKMGCAFALKHRFPIIKEQFEFFLRAYHEQGVAVDFICLDWEIDGPIEYNDAWAHSKRCKRCRENIPHIDDFRSFQAALRKLRCEMQREVFAKAVKAHFPKALIGNYAEYPNDGYRYWYDWFEQPYNQNLGEGVPYQADGRAKYREWARDFDQTGYTMAMPVVYPWAWTFKWYDFASDDYRWFYNLLKVASNACQHTPADVPVVPFVHWETVWHPTAPDPTIKQFSDAAYKELMWHMLLRGCDTLCMWCPRDTTGLEAKPVHEVYAAALEHKEFLDKGEPICLDVPATPASVISGLRIGDRALVRRTDFDANAGPVQVTVHGGTLTVPRVEGQCQMLTVTAK